LIRRLPIYTEPPPAEEPDVSEWSAERLEAFAQDNARRAAAERRSAISRRAASTLAEERNREATLDPLERVRRKIDRLEERLARTAPVERPSIAKQVAEMPDPVPGPPVEKKNPRELTEKQARILKLYEEGMRTVDVAAAVGATPAAVSACLWVLRTRGLVKREKSKRGSYQRRVPAPPVTLSGARLDAAIAGARARVAGGAEATVYEHDADRDAPVPRVRRPERREDCLPGGHNEARPCPFASCRHHLGLDVLPTGGIQLNFPDKEPWDLPHTCSLDLADQGGMTLDQVSKQLDVTRERIRQIEYKTLARLKASPRAKRRLEAFAEAERGTYEGLGIGGAGGEADEAPPAPAPRSAEDADELDDVRAGRPLYSAGRLPRFGEGEETEGYADAESEWVWAQLQKLELEKRGRAHDGSALEILYGVPLSPRAAQAVHFIRESWEERGSGPSMLEIADLCGVEGSTDKSRRAGVSVLLQGLREAKVLVFSRTQGAQIVEPKAKEAKSDGADSSGGRADRVAEPNAGRRVRDVSHAVVGLRGRGEPRGRAAAGREQAPGEEIRSEEIAGRSERGSQRAHERGVAAPARVFLCPEEGAAEVVELPEEPTNDPQPTEEAMADEVMLTEKQQAILDAYEAGGTAKEIAEKLGTTASAVDTTIYLLRKRGLVKRAKLTGGRRPALGGEAPPAPPARAPKVRVARKRRVQTPADVRANKVLSRKEERAAFAGLSGTTKAIVLNAKERIAEIDEKIGPLVAEKERLTSVVEMLKG